MNNCRNCRSEHLPDLPKCTFAGLAEVNICQTCRSKLFLSGGGGGVGGGRGEADVNSMFCVHILPPAGRTVGCRIV